MANREYVTVAVPVSGDCSKCGQTNHTIITAQGIRNATASASANGTCGDPSCGGSVHMTGSEET